MAKTWQQEHNERVARLLDALTSASASIQRALPFAVALERPLMRTQLNDMVEALERQCGNARALLF